MLLRVAPFVFLAAFLAGPHSFAASLTASKSERGVDILLSGDITAEDPALLDQFLRAVQADGLATRTLSLNSPGGSLVGGFALARLVQQHPEIATLVDFGSVCSSACFLVFAAGKEKIADYNSLIGVHGVGDGSGGETEETLAATQAMARFSNELGVPTDISEKMVTTPPSEIVWLTAEDLRRMGASMAGTMRREARSAPTERPPKDQAEISFETYAARSAAESAERGDFDAAIRLWRSLAERGHAVSQYNLGQMYYEGEGVVQSFEEAVKWYQRAADQGLPEAQLGVGVAYGLGRGVPRDLLKAYLWLSLAASSYTKERDREQATRARELVSTQMTATEIAAAKKLTGSWARSR
jgi:hypothetical protein